VILFGYDLQFDSFVEDLRITTNQFFKPERIFRVIKGATTNLVWLLVIFVTSYYLLHDWELLREWLFRLAPVAHQADLRHLHNDIKSLWEAYFRGQLLLMTIVGLFSGFTALAIGLPRAALVGLLAGVLDFIPSIGPTVATGAAAFIAWLEGSTVLAISNYWFVYVVVLCFAIIQLMENLWLQPYIFGRRVHLHRGIVFVAILGALTLGSALLALVIVPTIGSARLIGGYLHHHVFQQRSVSSTVMEQTLRPIETALDMQDEKGFVGEMEQ
jgi:predicted PurR-regulated permease PerM